MPTQSGTKPAPGETRLFFIVQAIRELFEGRSHAKGQCTLTASATTTTVSATNCGPNSEVFLSPRTANAAGALATTYVSAVQGGQFTLTHASAVSTDRTFGYEICG